MAKDFACPSCGKQTYSAKWKQCSNHGCKLNPRGGGPAAVTTSARPPTEAPTAPSKAPSMADETAMLRDEVARLKRDLAETHAELVTLRQLTQQARAGITERIKERVPISVPKRRGRPKSPLSKAQRQAAYRERKQRVDKAAT
jgi:hypothetical protein